MSSGECGIEDEYLGGDDISPEDREALERSGEDVRLNMFADDAAVRVMFELNASQTNLTMPLSQ
jgi:hypothetical protein